MLPIEVFRNLTAWPVFWWSPAILGVPGLTAASWSSSVLAVITWPSSVFALLL